MRHLAVTRARLKFFSKWTHVEFVTPRAAVLMSEVPECVGNRRRFEEVLVPSFGPHFAQHRHVDSSIHVDIRDVDALRVEIARQHLAKPPKRELGRCEGRGVWPWANPGGRTGKQDRAAPGCKHRGR